MQISFNMYIRSDSKWYRRNAEGDRECLGVFVEVSRHSEGYESGKIIASLEVEHKDGKISNRKKDCFIEFLPYIRSQEVKLEFHPVKIDKEDLHFFKTGIKPVEATTVRETEPEDPHQADVESLHYEEMRDRMLDDDNKESSSDTNSDAS